MPPVQDPAKPIRPQEPAAVPAQAGGQQQPSGFGGGGGAQQQPAQQQPTAPIPGLSPSGTLYWGPGVTNPNPADLEYSLYQAQQELAAQQQNSAQQQAMQVELTKRLEGWYDHHSRAIAGGVIGDEALIDQSVAPVAQGFEPFGVDYRGALLQPIHDQIRADVEEWTGMMKRQARRHHAWDPDPNWFQEVAQTPSGVPIVRIPAEVVRESGKPIKLPDGSEAWSMLYSAGPNGREINDAVVVLDQYGGVPLSLLQEDARKRSRLLWQGTTLDRAKEAVPGSPLKTAAVEALSTASFGMWGDDAGQKREARTRQMHDLKGEQRAETAGVLLGFVTPGGVPSQAFKGGRSLGLKAAGKVAEGSGKAAAVFSSRAGKFITGATGGVAGGLAYEAFRPNTGTEDFFVEEAAKTLADEGVPWEDALEQAQGELAAERVTGGAMIFGLIEFGTPAVAKAMRGVARGGFKVGEKFAGAAQGARASFGRDLARARFETVVGAGLTGAAQGTLMAGISPEVREAFGRWMESDYQDEDAWETLVQGWLIGAGIFAAHGATEAMIGYHGALRARLQETKGRLEGIELPFKSKQVPMRDGTVGRDPYATPEDVQRLAAMERRLVDKLWVYEKGLADREAEFARQDDALGARARASAAGLAATRRWQEQKAEIDGFLKLSEELQALRRMGDRGRQESESRREAFEQDQGVSPAERRALEAGEAERAAQVPGEVAALERIGAQARFDREILDEAATAFLDRQRDLEGARRAAGAAWEDPRMQALLRPGYGRKGGAQAATRHPEAHKVAMEYAGREGVPAARVLEVMQHPESALTPSETKVLREVAAEYEVSAWQLAERLTDPIADPRGTLERLEAEWAASRPPPRAEPAPPVEPVKPPREEPPPPAAPPEEPPPKPGGGEPPAPAPEPKPAEGETITPPGETKPPAGETAAVEDLAAAGRGQPKEEKSPFAITDAEYAESIFSMGPEGAVRPRPFNDEGKKYSDAYGAMMRLVDKSASEAVIRRILDGERVDPAVEKEIEAFVNDQRPKMPLENLGAFDVPVDVRLMQKGDDGKSRVLAHGRASAVLARAKQIVGSRDTLRYEGVENMVNGGYWWEYAGGVRKWSFDSGEMPSLYGREGKEKFGGDWKWWVNDLRAKPAPAKAAAPKPAKPKAEAPAPREEAPLGRIGDRTGKTVKDLVADAEALLGRKLTEAETWLSDPEQAKKTDAAMGRPKEVGDDFLRAVRDSEPKSGFTSTTRRAAARALAERMGTTEIPPDEVLPARPKPIKGTDVADTIKALRQVTDSDGNRFATQYVKVEGDRLVATDGRAMIVLEGKHGLEPGLYDPATVVRVEAHGEYPQYRNVIPKRGMGKVVASGDGEALARIAQKTKYAGQIHDGLGALFPVAEAHFGGPLRDVAETLTRLGVTKWEMRVEAHDKPALILAESPRGKIEAVIMPMSIKEGADAGSRMLRIAELGQEETRSPRMKAPGKPPLGSASTVGEKVVRSYDATREIPDEIPAEVVVSKKGINTAEERAAFEAAVSRVAEKGKEVAGVLGVNAEGELVAVKLKGGTLSRVKMNHGDLETVASKHGLEEILGVFHTHPGGGEPGHADRAAARTILDRHGLKLYVHDGTGLYEVAPGEVRAMGAIEPGDPALGARLRDRVVEVENLLAAEKDPARRELLEHEVARRRAEAEIAEVSLGGGDPKSLAARHAEAQGKAERDALGEIILEEGAAEQGWFSKWWHQIWSPSAETLERGYAQRTTYTPRGVTGQLRSPREFIPPAIYRKLREENNKARVVLDRMSRVLHGRGLEARIRYGQKPDEAAPLSRLKQGSASAAKVALASDGARVRDWNESEAVVAKWGKIEGDPNADIATALSPEERRVYDAVKPVWDRMRRHLWEHIMRHRRKSAEGALVRAAARIEKATEWAADVEGMTEKGAARRQELAAMRIREARAEQAEAQRVLDMIGELRDPDTGDRWGFERYFPHLMEEGHANPGDGWRLLSPIVQKELPYEKWLAFLQKRTGREGWSLDLHRVMETYVPQAFQKVAMDRVLDAANEGIFGERRRARNLEELGRSWHTNRRGGKQPVHMALVWRRGRDTRRLFAIPGTAQMDSKGNLVSMMVVDISSGERLPVFRSARMAKEAGVPDAMVRQEFNVLDGGLAQAWEKPEELATRIEYVENTVRRMLGVGKGWNKFSRALSSIARTATAYEYHAYIGALYPKAATTNVIFGSAQLVAEVGPVDAARGFKAAADILLHGRGNSTPETRELWRALRSSGTHLETFVGYDEAGGVGLGPPRDVWSKAVAGANTTSFFFFKNSERMIRAASFFGGYLKGRRAGMSVERATKLGEEVVANTQFDMGLYAAPRIVDHPLGFMALMLRRYAINFAERNIRGYAGLGHVAHAALVKKLGFNPMQAIRGELPAMSPEAKAVYERTIAKGDRPEHIMNSAYAMRAALTYAAVVWLYREIFGRDPRQQIAATPAEMPLLEKAHFAIADSELGVLMNMPIPGVTGPFDVVPLPAKLLGGMVEAGVEKASGNEYAMQDFIDKHRSEVFGRIGNDVWKQINAEAYGDEVVVKSGGKAHFTTSRKDLFWNMVLPGQTIESAAEWADSRKAYSESEMRRNRRETWSRDVLSDDPAKVQKAMQDGVREGFMYDPGDFQRTRELAKMPRSVRLILTAPDKTGRVEIATKMIPHYSEKELQQALYLLGAFEPQWWMDPGGKIGVKPDSLRAFFDAVRAKRDELEND